MLSRTTVADVKQAVDDVVYDSLLLQRWRASAALAFRRRSGWRKREETRGRQRKHITGTAGRALEAASPFFENLARVVVAALSWTHHARERKKREGHSGPSDTAALEASTQESNAATPPSSDSTARAEPAHTKGRPHLPLFISASPPPSFRCARARARTTQGCRKACEPSKRSADRTPEPPRP